MSRFKNYWKNIEPEFIISKNNLLQIADEFCLEMAKGLSDDRSSLKMLPSFLRKPSGQEQGDFIALDFGGTNVRIMRVDLKGKGKYAVIHQNSVPLISYDSHYDFTTSQTEGTQLFDFLAKMISRVAEDKNYRLGHTFSFPCQQDSINNAKLIYWTKEINTNGVEGKDINLMLSDALNRIGIYKVKPCAIINDTVGTLLTGAYINTNINIASICGTGHNSCYYDPKMDMIINLESGNFSKLPVTIYDRKIDDNSEKQGTQCLEKMVSGRYLGEIMFEILNDYAKDSVPYNLTAIDLSNVICGNLNEKFNYYKQDGDFEVLKSIASSLVNRSARLVAATYLGIIKKVDPEMKRSHAIAIDGSLYEKVPGYANEINHVFFETFGEDHEKIYVYLVKDGSGIGAAIAAALVF